MAGSVAWLHRFYHIERPFLHLAAAQVVDFFVTSRLVFVDTVIPGRVPGFEEIEPDVKTAWLGEQKEQAWIKAYAEMRAQYTVSIPAPPDEGAARTPVSPSATRSPPSSSEGPS